MEWLQFYTTTWGYILSFVPFLYQYKNVVKQGFIVRTFCSLFLNKIEEIEVV